VIFQPRQFGLLRHPQRIEDLFSPSAGRVMSQPFRILLMGEGGLENGKLLWPHFDDYFNLYLIWWRQWIEDLFSPSVGKGQVAPPWFIPVFPYHFLQFEAAR